MAFTTRPELRGTFGAVASTHWLASATGMGVLERGGNAFDAAVAAGFVLQVVEPHLNGPGGEVPILGCRPGDAEPFVICGQGCAPAAATIDHFRGLGLDIIPGTGQLAACVPGAFGAWLTLLRDWGTATLREVLSPAIGYAAQGHPLVPRIPHAIASVRTLFETEWPSSAAVYLPGGRVPEPGRLFRNPGLATFYAGLLADAETVGAREAQIGRALDYWYRGPLAEAVDRFSRTAVMDVSGRRHRGLITADDLARWQPAIERPLSVDYGDYRVFKCGPWSQGPALLQALQILSGFDLASMDPAGPEFIHTVTETIKLVMADRDAWYGDDPGVPLEALLSAEYAATRRALIGSEASTVLRPGAPGGRAPGMPPIVLAGTRGRGIGAGEPTVAVQGGQAPAVLDRRGEAVETADGARRGDTCHVDVIDRWGNVVAATPSGGWFQSSPVIPELGFGLTVRGQMFWLQEGLASSLAPGRRPRTTLTPSFAFRNGEPYLAFGTPGGDQQEQWSLAFLLRHIHHGMDLQAAIDAPGFHTDDLVASFWPREVAPGSLTLEGRMPTATTGELRRRGHAVTIGDDWSEGRLSACAREADGDSFLLKAAANPRGMQGYAVAR